MPNTLTHSPADIARWLLVDLGLATDPASGAAWPAFVAAEPASPDNCITVYDTTGHDDGRCLHDGRIEEHQGLQVRVRAKDHATGWQKIDAIRQTLAESVKQVTQSKAGSTYAIQGFSRFGDVVHLGFEPGSLRNLFTFNVMMTVLQQS